MHRRLSVLGSVTPVAVQRQVPGHVFWLSRGLSSSASPRRLLEEFLILGLLALLALGNVAHYSFAILYLAVFTSMTGCCMWNAEHWIIREMPLAVPQCLA